ncbi:MAG: alcohol acetyltransferase [Clostridia bacterium]
MKHPNRWMRLDNAALIYPATMNRNWTALFRISAELTETIDPSILEQAQRSTLARFPSMCAKLRRGAFWFYLEQSDDVPKLQKDVGNPCVRMRFEDNDGFALRVRYYQNRIAVEYFHVLTDGTGGLVFLQTLVAEYLRFKYGADISRGNGVLDCTEPPKNEEKADSFLVNSGSISQSRHEQGAYRIRGTVETDGFVNIITGMIDVDTVLRHAKDKGVSLTEYLTAVLILSIDALQRRTELRVSRYKPVKICVPINLRRFFPTETLRNFSSYVNPGIDPRLGMYTLDEVLSIVHHFMAMEITPKLLSAKITTNVKTERNRVLRVMPLFIKNTAMKLAYSRFGDRISSTCFSNLGVVKLPEEMSRYVTRIDFILGPLAVNRVCMGAITYNGTLGINFTRTIEEPEVEREFFTRLIKLGIPVKIESNQR